MEAIGCYKATVNEPETIIASQLSNAAGRASRLQAQAARFPGTAHVEPNVERS
jgi:hypothetical protein